MECRSANITIWNTEDLGFDMPLSNEELGQSLEKLLKDTGEKEDYYKALVVKRIETARALSDADAELSNLEGSISANRTEILEIVQKMIKRGLLDRAGL